MRNKGDFVRASPPRAQAKHAGRRVPRLRFPEYRDAGEWEEKYLGQVLNITSCKRIYEADWAKEGVPFYRARELVALNNGERISPLYISEKLYQVNTNLSGEIKAGDLLVTGVGSIGIPYLVKLHDRFYFKDGNIIWLQNDEHEILGSFLLMLFLSDFIQQQIIKAAGIGTVGTYTIENANKTNVIYPMNKTEQLKIASCLSSLDALIATHSKKLDALKKYKKGLMQQLFPAEGESVPRLRFPEFRDAGEWDENELGRLTVKVGSGITPLGGEVNYKRSGRPFIRSQNVGWGNLILDDVVNIDEATHSTFSATEVTEGDVLLNITGASIGRSAVADSRIHGGNVNQHVCIIRTKEHALNPYFLNQFLLSQIGQKQIDSFQAGGNRQGLNFAQIRSFSLYRPSYDEQIKISSCLSSLDDLIVAQAAQIEKLKTYKKGLMQGLFPSAAEADR